MDYGQRMPRLYSSVTAMLVIPPGLVAVAATNPNKQTDRRRIELVPIKVKLPMAQFVGTPQDIRAPRVKTVQTKPGPPFLAPVGTRNVALGTPVSSSDPEPVIGELEMITDGDKEASEGSFVELGPLLQHVTVDLQSEHAIYGVRVWHYHCQPRVYFDVIIRVSNDPNFATGVKTVFNNDMNDSTGLGTGRDMHYVDTRFGELFDAKGVRGRYVRFYSSGNTSNDLNHYIEIEVYGKPAVEVPELVPISTELPRYVAPDTLSYRFLMPDPNKPRGVSLSDAGSADPGKAPLNPPGLVPLEIQYPAPLHIGFGRWEDVPYREDFPKKPPALLLVPEGTKNAALGKPVSSSHPDLIIGTLKRVTDGDKKTGNDSIVELDHGGLQHITIDLQGIHEIYAIAIWHYYRVPRVYFDVIVQISKNPMRSGTRRTVYNSDLDNSAGLGVGKDKRYVETNFGKVIEVRGIQGRYVRLHSNGNSVHELNHYIEVEVYGKPVK